MSEAFHLQFTATDPEAVAVVFSTIGASFCFEPCDRDFSYQKFRAGDEDLTVFRVDLVGSYSS